MISGGVMGMTAGLSPMRVVTVDVIINGVKVCVASSTSTPPKLTYTADFTAATADSGIITADNA
jgi:hypothetical protein